MKVNISHKECLIRKNKKTNTSGNITEEKQPGNYSDPHGTVKIGKEP
jgi:hypothetical protein